MRTSHVKLEKLMLQEEIRWRQKSWMLLLKEGDKDMNFFHLIANSPSCRCLGFVYFKFYPLDADFKQTFGADFQILSLFFFCSYLVSQIKAPSQSICPASLLVSDQIQIRNNHCFKPIANTPIPNQPPQTLPLNHQPPIVGLDPKP